MAWASQDNSIPALSMLMIVQYNQWLLHLLRMQCLRTSVFVKL